MIEFLRKNRYVTYSYIRDESFQDYKDARERKEKNKALIMQMHPSAFASSAGSHYASTGRGSGFI